MENNVNIKKTELEKAEELIKKRKDELEQAKNRKKDILARQKKAERKLDSKRKAILGSALIHALKYSDKRENWLRAIEQLLEHHIIRDFDKKAFDGWNIPEREITENENKNG